MTKNDFKRLVPDVCCQDLILETGNADGMAARAQGIADMMGMGLIAYDYTAARDCYHLKVFTSQDFKPFLDALKPGAKVTDRLGREFTIESEPYVANLRMCVRANGDTWFCDTLYDKDKDYGKED